MMLRRCPTPAARPTVAGGTGRRPRTARVRGALLLALASTCLVTTSCSAVPPAAQPSASQPAIRRIVLPRHPHVYFFGDSWTHGASAEEGRGFPHVVGEALGWDVEVGPDNSGAGYVHTYDPSHPIFLERIQQLKPIHADLVIIEGGLNDIPGSSEHKLWETVVSTIKALKTKAGGAPVVMVGPLSPDGVVSEGLSGIDYEESGVAAGLRVPYISPVKDGWFNPTNVKALVDAETYHPNTAGHAYYGGRLASALSRLTTTR